MKGFFICPACKGNGYRRIIKDNDPKEKVVINCEVCNNQGEIKDLTMAGVAAADDHTFVIRWDNQNAASDAFIRYQVNVKREVTGFTLYPFTEREITNHEWRDMVFTVDKE